MYIITCVFLYCRKNSGASSGKKRQSRILHKFSLRRHGSSNHGTRRGGDGDRVRLVESEGGEGEDEENVTQRDVMSDAEIDRVKVRKEGEERERKRERVCVCVCV